MDTRSVELEERRCDGVASASERLATGASDVGGAAFELGPLTQSDGDHVGEQDDGPTVPAPG